MKRPDRRARRYALAAVVLAAVAVGAARPAGALVSCAGDCDGDDAVRVEELLVGVRQALGLSDGPACAAFDRDRSASVTVDELLTGVRALLDGCPFERVPFDVEVRADELRLTPTLPLRGRAMYTVVLTDAVRDLAGRPLRADAAFAVQRGVPAGGDGPVARFTADPTAPGNPYPDGRLAGTAGVVIPDHIALRGLADTPRLAQARAALRATADAIGGAAAGFSTTAPMRVALSGPVDPATLHRETVLFVRRRDDDVALAPLLAELARQGVPRASVALAISFPTQSTSDALVAVRERLDGLAVPPRVRFDGAAPDDDLPLGIFTATSAAYGAWLAANPAVALVARGRFPSPEFRGADGLFDAARLGGAAPAPPVELDVLLTVPHGAGPHPVVLVQHGFAGDRHVALDVGALLATRGFAAIGIDAVSHGRRGNPLALLRASALQTRDMFRQTVADQLALVRAIRGGIDLTGDGAADLAGAEIGYLGISLGGILGGLFVALEPTAETAVLTVAGGRVAFLGDNPGTRPIYQAALAEQAGLPLDDPDFETFLQNMLYLGQHALDPADPLNYAAHWRRAPLPGGGPRRVLLQEGIGDLLVSNESTEALAAAGELRADVPRNDPAGVSGLWRFAPPGGHGIFARADVRAQALEFLASRGTNLIAP